jgi:hypothetical protein
MVLSSRQQSFANSKEDPMRSLIAIATVLAVGFGVKLFFFSSPTAEANVEVVNSVRMDISQMHQNIKDLPVQQLNDMSVGID